VRIPTPSWPLAWAALRKPCRSDGTKNRDPGPAPGDTPEKRSEVGTLLRRAAWDGLVSLLYGRLPTRSSSSVGLRFLNLGFAS
jgi:hypothetical protein